MIGPLLMLDVLCIVFCFCEEARDLIRSKMAHVSGRTTIAKSAGIAAYRKRITMSGLIDSLTSKIALAIETLIV